MALLLALSRHSLCSVAYFSSPTCWDHNFFILTRIWACEVSLESSLNATMSGVESFDALDDKKKFIFPMIHCETFG